ncbi:MAG: hypothetical protein K0S09_1915 [Sphingobacteriaceae bacterium]|nr:hypothetical protein [Sphingobacteriaceae bacterium]
MSNDELVRRFYLSAKPFGSTNSLAVGYYLIKEILPSQHPNSSAKEAIAYWSPETLKFKNQEFRIQLSDLYYGEGPKELIKKLQNSIIQVKSVDSLSLANNQTQQTFKKTGATWEIIGAFKQEYLDITPVEADQHSEESTLSNEGVVETVTDDQSTEAVYEFLVGSAEHANFEEDVYELLYDDADAEELLQLLWDEAVKTETEEILFQILYDTALEDEEESALLWDLSVEKEIEDGTISNEDENLDQDNQNLAD